MAERQFAGRGQMGSRWEAKPGENLTFSVVLYPYFLSPAAQFRLSMAVSLGVLHVIKEELGGESRIKWPNDLFFRDKKLGGILIENVLSGSRLKATVAGIGLNVNQVAFPGLEQASSLRLLSGRTYATDRLLERLCGALEAAYLQLKSGRPDALKSSYLGQLLGYGEERGFRAGERRFTGVIRDVTPEGKLVLECGGEKLLFDRKEIAMVFP